MEILTSYNIIIEASIIIILSFIFSEIARKTNIPSVLMLIALGILMKLGLDALGLIGSGALLIAAQADRASQIVERLHAEGIAAETIGSVVESDRACIIRDAKGATRPLPSFARDEITRLFE